VRRLSIIHALVIVSFAAVGLVNFRFPFLGPPKPIKGFGYPLTPGEFAQYQVTVRFGEDMTTYSYRVLLVRETAEKGEPILTIEHSETFSGDSRSVVQFDINKREWNFFVGAPAKHPLVPRKITLQKASESPTVIESEPGLSVFGRKLGFGFHFLENFSLALKDVQPGTPQQVSFGDPPRKVSALPYNLNYQTDDYYEGELPRRVETTISGTLLASDEIPFGIVRAELNKSIKRTYDVPGVKAPPEVVRLQVTLTLQSIGKNGISHLTPPAPPKGTSAPPPQNAKPDSSGSHQPKKKP
jgi:hypothetical protein